MRWERIPISAESAYAPDLYGPREWTGYAPAGPGVDFLWEYTRLYLMKEPGRAKCIWRWTKLMRQRGGMLGITSVRYDGRYGWMVMNDESKSTLVVIDPRTEQTWEIGADAGLPVAEHQETGNLTDRPCLWVEPLEPGRALLVCWFGRLALAIAKFDPSGSSKVEVFHEARDRLDPRKVSGTWGPNAAVWPDHVLQFRGTQADGRPLRRVLVWRASRSPLVVDPDQRTVDVMPGGPEQGFTIFHNEAAADAMYDTRGTDLLRFGLPDFRPQLVCRNVPDGYVVLWGRKFLVMDRQCWLVDPKAPPPQQVRLVADHVPWPDAGGNMGVPPWFMRSNHYGLVANYTYLGSREVCYVFCRAVFEEPADK